MTHAKLLDTDIDHRLLESEIHQLIDQHQLHDQNQISLTSITGDNDWLCSIGKLAKLPYPERYYGTINSALCGTYIEQCISRYSTYYRWRLLKLTPGSTYSIHQDIRANGDLNIRLHIPVATNPRAYLMFFDSLPEWSENSASFYHLEAGNTYEVNTSGMHTAVNFSTSHTRYHIVGVKYENSNNWDH